MPLNKTQTPSVVFQNLDGIGWAIGLMSRVFTSGLRDWGSIPGRVIPKTKKWYLMPPCLTLSIIK